MIPKPFCKIILYERDILYLKSSQSRASIRFSAATLPTTLSTNAFQHANKENARRALKSNFVGVADTDEGQFELFRLTTPALERNSRIGLAMHLKKRVNNHVCHKLILFYEIKIRNVDCVEF